MAVFAALTQALHKQTLSLAALPVEILRSSFAIVRHSENAQAETKSDHGFLVGKHPILQDTCREALYREALNSRASGLISYAVLNFYKIIEIKNQKNGQAKRWFGQNFRLLESDSRGDREDIKRFTELRGETSPEEYIHKSCRIAVAHASSKSKSDPDDAEEIIRLHTVARIMSSLAKIFIEKEFGISKLQYSGD